MPDSVTGVPITAAATPDPSSPRDIVAIVQQYTNLVPYIGGQLRGPCPFCRSAHFRVRAEYGTFHCFGCGEGGTGSRFLARIELDG